MVNKGVALGRLNRSEEATGAYDEVVRRFGGSSLPALQNLVAQAQAGKGPREG